MKKTILAGLRKWFLRFSGWSINLYSDQKGTFQRQREMNIDRVRIKKKQNDFYRNQSTIFETSDTGHALSRHEEAQRRREVCSIL